jgi:hypothetical protein
MKRFDPLRVPIFALPSIARLPPCRFLDSPEMRRKDHGFPRWEFYEPEKESRVDRPPKGAGKRD